VVVLAIALIDVPQVVAGEIIALKAESNLIVSQPLTVALEKGALLIARAASGAVSYFAPPPGQIMRISQIAAADAAVHAARSD
jgi:hypothetical protein